MKTDPTLGQALRDRRAKRGHGLRDAAELIGYRSPESVRQVESGQPPREPYIPGIARYLRWSQRRVRVAIAEQQIAKLRGKAGR